MPDPEAPATTNPSLFLLKDQFRRCCVPTSFICHVPFEELLCIRPLGCLSDAGGGETPKGFPPEGQSLRDKIPREMKKIERMLTLLEIIINNHIDTRKNAPIGVLHVMYRWRFSQTS